MAESWLEVSLSGETMRFPLIRSARRTLALELSGETILIRAPRLMSEARIRSMVQEKEHWIRQHLKRIDRTRQEAGEPLSEAELLTLKQHGKTVFAQRAAYYAQKIGVTYGTSTVRAQKSRWGSCSAAGNLSFNCLLLLAPPEVLDSVVVHELCHRLHMDHSAAFYGEVLRVFPEYRKHNAWLKQHGAALLLRAGKS